MKFYKQKKKDKFSFKLWIFAAQQNILNYEKNLWKF